MKQDTTSLLTRLAVGALAVRALVRKPGSQGKRIAPPEHDAPKERSEATPSGKTRSDSRAEGPGQDAGKPSEIPAKGWWAVAKRVANGVSEHRIMTEAAAVTFYTLLALFPALAALVSIYGLFADPATISNQISGMSQFVPGGGMQIISDQIHSLASNSNKSLGFALVLGLATSLWSANQATKSLFDALNVVYDEREKRGFLLRTAITLASTLGGIVFVLLAMGAVVVVPVLLKMVGLGAVGGVLLNILRWPALLVALGALLACIYRFGPSREQAGWHWVSWGGGFAAVSWVVVSIAFSWYVSNFGSYNKTYGSLGAAIGFMTWIWLSATVVLTGGEINAELEHQTGRDTTTGPEKPRGTRGATKADEVAS